MKLVLIEILRGHLVVILFVLASYIIEKNSQWKLLFFQARDPKSNLLAQGMANLHAILYFLVCMGTFLFDVTRLESIPVQGAFWKWLIIMIPLTIAFRMIYYRFTPKDPDRDDFDFSA